MVSSGSNQLIGLVECAAQRLLQQDRSALVQHANGVGGMALRGSGDHHDVGIAGKLGVRHRR